MNDRPSIRIVLSSILVTVILGILSGGAADPLPFDEPPFVNVSTLAQNGSWQWEGVVNGNLSAALRDVEAQMKRSGWRLQHAIPMKTPGTPGMASEPPANQLLATWEKGDQALLVLLRDGAAGHTHFLAGLAPHQSQASFQNRHRNP